MSLARPLFAAAFSCIAASAQPITTSALEKASNENSSWLMYSRDYHGHRFVKVDQITPDNVNRLHPVWVFATGGENRGLEATPLLHKGILYLSADESRVFAIDPRTGAKQWSYDPKMSDAVERVYCCGSINRGVALFGELVYIGTMDARLVALQKDTGDVVWETEVIDWEQVLASPAHPSSSTAWSSPVSPAATTASEASSRPSTPRQAHPAGRPTRSPVRASPATTLGPATPGSTVAAPLGPLVSTTPS